MAATTAGALKQIIEALGLGLAAYRDEAPAAARLPYVVIQDGITKTRLSRSNGVADSAPDALIENCQVDLYQSYIDPTTGKVVESSALAEALERGLHGSAPASASADISAHIYGVRVPFSTRARRADDNTVRTRLSVNVHRNA